MPAICILVKAREVIHSTILLVICPVHLMYLFALVSYWSGDLGEGGVLLEQVKILY